MFRFKSSRLVQEPEFKSKLLTFPSSKILLNEPVKIQTQPTLSFKIVSKAITETIEQIEMLPSKEIIHALAWMLSVDKSTNDLKVGELRGNLDEAFTYLVRRRIDFFLDFQKMKI